MRTFLNKNGVNEPAPRILAKELTPLSLHNEIVIENLYSKAHD